MSSAPSLTQDIKDLAVLLGFDRAGVAPAAPVERAAFVRDWLARGRAGAMSYLEKRVEERLDPNRLMPETRSVVCVGLRYATGEEPGAGAGRGRVSRYAAGDDYHDVVLDRLRALEAGIEALAERPVRSRAYVDTGPVLERAHAARAGLGWIGKNTCLIDPRLGSYLFLGVLLTDLELVPDAPEPDHCGSCRACLDACPTDAFEAPYVLDPLRCIAYTTIEDPGAVPEALRVDHGDRIFGCDVCQEVCPWNDRSQREAAPDPLGLRERLAPRETWRGPSLAWLLELDEDAWRDATRPSAMRRGKRRGLLRNALVAAGNAADPALRPQLERHARGDDPLLAEHARWALGRLESASPAR